MLTMSAEELRRRAESLGGAIRGGTELVHGFSAVGGGSFPAAELETTLVAVDPGPLGATGLALRLRLGTPPVIARVHVERVVLDPRTLPEEALPDVAAAVSSALSDHE
jgi:L-seryl-tRNA(Ser) seleniumtransferase